MKVKDLIEELKKYDENLNVYVSGYEGGVNDMPEIGKPITVALNVNTEWYYGKHEEIESDDEYNQHQKAEGILL